MKKIIYLLCIALVASSCSYEAAQQEDVATKSQRMAVLYNVNRDLAWEYAKSSCPLKAKLTEIDLQPIIEASDTVLYIINYGTNNGFQLIGADMRCSLPIASGNDKPFDINFYLENDNPRAWFEGEKAFVVELRRHGAEVSNDQTVAIWKALQKDISW
jgi:hypothetical protein